MKSISERVEAYHSGQADAATAIDAIAEFVYRYPVGKSGFNEEDAAEFLLRFYPRIRRLIERYRPTGSCFELYLNSSLKFHLRTFAARQANDRIRLSTEAQPEIATEIREAPETSPYSVDTIGPRTVYPLSPRQKSTGPLDFTPPSRGRADGLTPSEAQRVLVMALKAGDLLTPELCRDLAEWIGWDSERLLDTWIELRAMYEPFRVRRSRLAELRDMAWFRVRCVESRIRLATEEAERISLNEERTRWLHRYHRSRRRLSVMPAGPSHAQIAQVLGIPKGTIDSSVFKARREIADRQFLDRLARLFEES